MAKEGKKLINCLRDEVVVVKFVPRLRGDITDNPRHVAHGGMLDNSYKEFIRDVNRNGQPKNVLTKDEKEFLEDLLGFENNELSTYNKKYWGTKKVRLYKSNNVFDLKDPDQYIKYKILLTNDSLIAKCREDIPKRRTYQFYVEQEGAEEKRKIKRISSSMQAYKLYGKYEDNADILRFALKELNKITKKSIKLEDLQGYIGDEISERPAKVAEILSDKYLSTKVLIDKGVECGVIKKRGKEYFSVDGKKLAKGSTFSSMQECAEYLNEPKNQEEKLIIEAQIKKITK